MKPFKIRNADSFMKNKFLISLFLFVLLLLFGSVEQVLACSCKAERPVCEALGGNDVVFVGKVVGGKQTTVINEGVTENWTVGEIHFQVEEGFLGVKKGSQITIRSGKGGGDCGYWFKSEETYLVYGYGNSTNGFSTNICTRTRHISRADEDLDLLRKLVSKKSGANLLGIIREEAGLDDYNFQNTKPSKSINILLQPVSKNGKVYKAKTDADGKFEVTGLLAGEYKLIPLLAKNKVLNRWSQTKIESNGFGCLTQWAVIENKNELKGSVINAEGNPVADAYTVLISADSDFSVTPKSKIPTDSVDSDKNGNFTYTSIPAGRYFLAVNYTYPPDNEGADYPTTFYPKGNIPLQAKPIIIGESSKISGIVFQLPPKVKQIKIKGKLIWSNGEPIGNFWGVSLVDINYGGTCSNCWGKITNNKGEFELTGYEGRKYRLTVDGKITFNGNVEKRFKTESSDFILDSKTAPFILTLEKPNNIAKNSNNQ